MPSIKKNFVYNSILTLSNYIFPLITFPYVTRILGVHNIGICSFVDSIINFYLLFATLGISIVGIREIAKDRLFDDKESLNRTFSSIFTFNLLSTVVAVFVLIISILIVPQFSEYKHMLFIGGAKIISSLFLIEWLYKGLEEFKYITARSIIIKGIYVISVFVFVKTSNDYILYFGLTALMVILNALVNWTYKKRYVKFNFSFMSLSKYSKSIFSLGLYLLLTSMYTTFNVLYLGFVAGEKEVGYYATAIKLYSIILALFTAFTTVMLPRISSLVAENNFSKVRSMIKVSFELLLSFCIPLVFLSVLLAPQIIDIIAGKGYEGAIIPMRIVMPLIMIIGIAQILVIQILMPIRADKSILVNSLIGASLSIVFNILLVGKMGSIGSAISLLISECAVTVSAAYFVYKKTNLAVPVKLFLKHILVGTPYLVIYIFAIYFLDLNVYLQLTIILFLSFFYYIFSQIKLVKNEKLIELIKVKLEKKM